MTQLSLFTSTFSSQTREASSISTLEMNQLLWKITEIEKNMKEYFKFQMLVTLRTDTFAGINFRVFYVFWSFSRKFLPLGILNHQNVKVFHAKSWIFLKRETRKFFWKLIKSSKKIIKTGQFCISSLSMLDKSRISVLIPKTYVNKITSLLMHAWIIIFKTLDIVRFFIEHLSLSQRVD